MDTTARGSCDNVDQIQRGDFAPCVFVNSVPSTRAWPASSAPPSLRHGMRPQDCDVASAATVKDCDAAVAALEECGAATLPVAAHVERAHACGFKVHSTQT